MSCPEQRPASHPRAARIVAGARAELGVCFRAQGRGAGGLDCIGLIGRAAEAAGILIKVPPHPLRGIGLEHARRMLQEAGCGELDLDEAQPGDLLVAAPATLQVHFALRTELGVIEANALLRRVVERPCGAGERWQSAWRLPQGEG
jgi:cell wall-associated NlpC family hydrolase